MNLSKFLLIAPWSQDMYKTIDKIISFKWEYEKISQGIWPILGPNCFNLEYQSCIKYSMGLMKGRIAIYLKLISTVWYFYKTSVLLAYYIFLRIMLSFTTLVIYFFKGVSDSWLLSPQLVLKIIIKDFWTIINTCLKS